MDLPQEPQKSEEPAQMDDTVPEDSGLPEDFTPISEITRSSRSRRRRTQRMLILPGADGRSAMLDQLARRAVPSIEFFLFAFFCGVVLGAGYLLDLKMNSVAFLLLGMLLAPTLTPWVGMTMAAVTGSWRFFFLTLGGMVVACALIFLTGGLAGLAARLWLPLPAQFQADIRSHLWWLDLFVVALGAVLLVISFVHSEQKPILSSTLVAYGLFVPLSAAGFEFGLGTLPAWYNGLLVFAVHLTLATLVGGIVLLVLRFKPARLGGFILLILVGLVSIVSLFLLTGLTNVIRNGITSSRRIEPTATLVSLPSITATSHATFTKVPTQAPSATLFPTSTPVPTPAYSMINALSFGGANMRTEPGAGDLLVTLNNGLLVQVLPEIQNVGNVVWVHIRWGNLDGWVLQSVLTVSALTPTPIPSPSLTATP